MLTCPNCTSQEVDKVISVMMPMKLCRKCNCLWGEPFATIYTEVFAPMEGSLNGGFTFFPYEGNYLQGLIKYFKAV